MSIYSDDYTVGSLGGAVEDYHAESPFDHDPMEWERGGQDHEDDQRDPDVFASGFLVETGGTTRWKVPHCRYCATPLFVQAPRWMCEFSGDVTSRPTFTGYNDHRTRTVKCKCTACEFNAIVYRSGKPPTVCSGDECTRRRRREERAGERARRNERARQVASRWLTDHPTMTDRDIADRAGIRPIRVKEARSLVAA